MVFNGATKQLADSAEGLDTLWDLGGVDQQDQSRQSGLP